MPVFTEEVLLRIFIGEDDHYDGHPLGKAIVKQALKSQMAGATLLYGPQSFGKSGHVRTELNVDSGPNLPVIVEIIDTESKINDFLPTLHQMLDSGLVTLEKVRAFRYAKPTH